MSTEDRTYIEKWDAYVQTWKRRTFALGVALAFSIGLITPFLEGHFLHRYFDQGKYVIFLACTLFSLFVVAAALTLNFWMYARRLRSGRTD
jgi:uncharacterized membrane protein YjdF